MKVFRIIRRSIRDAFKSVFRNFSLSMASILCATITLMVVAISLLIAGNVNSITKDLESELSIVVYLEESAKEDDISFLESKIKAIKRFFSYGGLPSCKQLFSLFYQKTVCISIIGAVQYRHYQHLHN